MSEEWGPWIEHDGKGCPVVGFLVETIDAYGTVDRFIAGTQGVTDSGKVVPFAWDASAPNVWNWPSLLPEDIGFAVIRYRVRKPLGLTILEGLIERLPEKVDA